MAAKLIGQTIGEKYDILAQLGAGGMGAVYQARDLKLDRIVAIKVLHIERDADPTSRGRFLREAQALALLEHPSVLPIYELIEEGDTAYMVMQYVKGGSLKDVIHEAWDNEAPSGLDSEYVVTVISQVARALDYAHNLGIIHRDIKPGNILLTEEGRTLLADFGIAKWADVTQSASLTGEGVAVGTPAYMSPEQINARKLGPASDVYSLAIVTYQLLTGHCPFEGDTISVIYKQINEPPPPPTELNADIPPEVEEVLLKALDKDPSKRFQSAGAFAQALKTAFAPITGEIAVERGAFIERVREHALWGRLLGRRRWREPAEGVAGLFQEFAARVLRFMLTVGIALLVIFGLLLLSLSLLLSRFAENAIANAEWDFAEDHVTYTGEELSQRATEGADFVLAGTFRAVGVDFRPPNSITVVGELSSGGALSLNGTLQLSDQNQLVVTVHRFNNLPLLFYGSIISDGVNRGIAAALDKAQVNVEGMTVNEATLVLSVSGPGIDPIASEPPPATPTPETALVPVPALFPLAEAVRVQMSNWQNADVTGVAWSPDGRVLAAGLGHPGNEVSLWDVEAGELLGNLEGEDLMQAVAWSPDGNFIAAGTLDDAVILWDAWTREEVARLAHPRTVSCVVWSPDSAQLATASGNTIFIWDRQAGELLTTLEGHINDVSSLAWSPDGTVLASGSWDATIILWDIQTDERLRTLEGHTGNVASVAWSPDGATLASGSWDDTVMLWNPQSGEPLRTLAEHTDNVSSVTWSPDGAWLASGSHDHSVMIWNVNTGESAHTLEEHDYMVFSLAWSPDGMRLASGGGAGLLGTGWLIVWEFVRDETEEVRTLGGPGTINSITWSPDGTTLASAGWDRALAREVTILWDTQTREQRYTLDELSFAARCVAWSPDGTTLAIGGEAIALWDMLSDTLLLSSEVPSVVNSIAWSPDGTTLASGLDNAEVILWNAQTGERLRTLTGHTNGVLSVAWSPDGTALASGSSDDTVILWDAVTGARLRTLTGHTGWVHGVAWSPDGTMVASGAGDATVILWDAQTGELLYTLEEHRITVRSVTWSPDGSILASGSNDNTVILWDTATGGRLRTLRRHIWGVYSVAWSPDGSTLASGSWDGAIILWEIEPPEAAP